MARGVLQVSARQTNKFRQMILRVTPFQPPPAGRFVLLEPGTSNFGSSPHWPPDQIVSVQLVRHPNS
jgi:hypothetical protein